MKTEKLSWGTIAIHFHPEASRLPAPSFEDLNALELHEEFHQARHIVGIATIGKSQRGTLLLLQNVSNNGKIQYAREELLQQAYTLDEKQSSFSLESTLTIPNFIQAAVLPFTVASRGYQSSIGNTDKIRNFGYTFQPCANPL